MQVPFDLPNPFQNGKIVSTNTDPEVYRRTTGDVPCGSPGFVMSNSQLCSLLDSSPSKWRKGIPHKDTDATEWGTWLDTLWVCRRPDQFAVTPETYPDTKTKAPKPWNRNATFCKDWERAQPGKLIVKPAEMADLKVAAAHLDGKSAASALREASNVQVFALAEYKDPETKIVVPVKILIDLCPTLDSICFADSLADLKTARSAKPRAWQRAVFESRYHVQGALYLDVYNAATGEARTSFRHIISENEPPYEPAIRLLSQEFIDLGRLFYRAALQLYCRCLATNTWPDYDAMVDNYQGWPLVQPEAWMLEAVPTLPAIASAPVEPRAEPVDLIP